MKKKTKNILVVGFLCGMVFTILPKTSHAKVKENKNIIEEKVVGNTVITEEKDIISDKVFSIIETTYQKPKTIGPQLRSMVVYPQDHHEYKIVETGQKTDFVHRSVNGTKENDQVSFLRNIINKQFYPCWR